jgi:hypothetical protein
MNSYKTITGSSPNKAQSIHTTNSPSQSREIDSLFYLAPATAWLKEG